MAQSFSSSDATMQALLSRSSTDALLEPAPQGDQLKRILSSGLRAPDHGKLRPWRYVIVEGDARDAFAREVVAAVERHEPETPEAKKEKRFQRFSTMPMVIGLGMNLQPDHKIPLEEQVMSVAAGAMNVLNALHLEGFGGVWVSGAFCEDRTLRTHMGLDAPHRLAGFLLVGTPQKPDRIVRRPDVEGYMVHWTESGKVSFPVDERERS